MAIDALVAAAPEIGSLLGFGGETAAAVAPAAIGAGEAAAGGAAAGGATLADLVGTGTALAGGETGLAGTALAGGAGSDIAALTATPGLGVLGSAGDFLTAPGASGFAPQAAAGASAFGVAPAESASLPASIANANAFSPADVNTAGIPGLSSGTPATAPSGIPAGGGAASVSAPSGVAAPVDATSSIAGATGPTSVGGAPLNAAPPSSIESLLGKAGGGALDSLTKNPLGIALGAGGLGYNILQGQKNTKNQDALTADARQATANSNQMVASGEALQQYLTSGTLPPAYQTQVDQAIKDAKTSAISNAAQQGQNTDPTQNTALAATLAKIDASRATMQTQVASQLFSSGQGLVNSGAQAAGLSGQLFQALVQNDTTQAANTGKAIATLAAALNGKSQNSAGGITISQG